MKSSARPSWLKRRVWRAAALALGHLVLAFAVLTGIGHSGARYFYCDALGLMASDPCVQASQTRQGRTETLSAPLADCCEVVTLPGLPEGARAQNPTVPPPARIAVLPVESLALLGTIHELQSLNLLLERWRPPPRGPSEARAQLMVFLT